MNNESIKTQDKNEEFYNKCRNAFRILFQTAKDKNEINFAMALNPEGRGCQAAGWNTAEEANIAFDQYLEFINGGKASPIKVRVALGFYSLISEASGFYEIPKNMLRICEGQSYVLWPFQDIVQKDRDSQKTIAPNANKIMKNLADHAYRIGLIELSEVFKDAFDSDLRNGYAHADYIIWNDGVRLRKRNGGTPRTVGWAEFHELLEKGINFYVILRETIVEAVHSYNPPKIFRGRAGTNEPELNWKIFYDIRTKRFSISCSVGDLK